MMNIYDNKVFYWCQFCFYSYRLSVFAYLISEDELRPSYIVNDPDKTCSEEDFL